MLLSKNSKKYTKIINKDNELIYVVNYDITFRNLINKKKYEIVDKINDSIYTIKFDNIFEQSIIPTALKIIHPYYYLCKNTKNKFDFDSYILNTEQLFELIIFLDYNCYKDSELIDIIDNIFNKINLLDELANNNFLLKWINNIDKYLYKNDKLNRYIGKFTYRIYELLCYLAKKQNLTNELINLVNKIDHKFNHHYENNIKRPLELGARVKNLIIAGRAISMYEIEGVIVAISSKSIFIEYDIHIQNGGGQYMTLVDVNYNELIDNETEYYHVPISQKIGNEWIKINIKNINVSNSLIQQTESNNYDSSYNDIKYNNLTLLNTLSKDINIKIEFESNFMKIFVIN